jgi:predicted acyl esterase
MKICMQICKIFLFFIFFTFFISQSNFSQVIKRNIDYYEIPKLPYVQNPNKELYTIIKNDFNLQLRDGVILDCSKFYPDAPNPYLQNGYPTVIMVHGYGDSKVTLENFARAQSEYGYCVYTFSVRGQGNSGGLSNLISRTEALDLIDFVNYVKHDFTTGLDTSKVLITGGSQGGILPFMASCMGMKVRCIISALSSPQFASSWIENGSIKMTFLWTIDYTQDTARYAPQVIAMRNWVYNSDTKAKWDSLAYWLPQNRDYNNILSQCGVPILIENAWQDKFFNALGNLSTIPLITVPDRYYFGAVKGHGGDTSHTENLWHMNFFDEWYYYWLFDINNGILTRPKYHYAYTMFPEINNMWSFGHDSTTSFPPQTLSTLKLYFNKNNQLTNTPNINNNDFVNLNNTVASGYTLTQAVQAEFKGSEFNSNFQKAQLVFNTNPLTQDVIITNTPTISLDYSSNANLCQYNFQIYEVNNTKAKLITRVNYTDRNYTVNSRKTYAIQGLSHSHKFKAGNRIRVIVTNLDTAPDDVSFLATNPHVLPVMVNGINKMYLNSNCYLNFPVLSGGTTFVSNTGTDVPKNYSLSQNYPNPFNPITRINYDLPENANVKLTIFNILGVETKTLVNEFKTAGRYSVEFDGGNLASGMYFYRLIVEDRNSKVGNEKIYSAVKKMVLIK